MRILRSSTADDSVNFLKRSAVYFAARAALKRYSREIDRNYAHDSNEMTKIV